MPSPLPTFQLDEKVSRTFVVCGAAVLFFEHVSCEFNPTGRSASLRNKWYVGSAVLFDFS